jgi:hypothetical protein
MARSKALGAAAVALAMVALAPAEAAAETVELGGTADVDLVDIENGGDLEIDQEWTISDLRPSADAIPYRVVGTLWEAVATAELENGGVPVITGFFARSGSDSYHVTGPAPTSVAYLDSEGELVEWGTPAG